MGSVCPRADGREELLTANAVGERGRPAEPVEAAADPGSRALRRRRISLVRDGRQGLDIAAARGGDRYRSERVFRSCPRSRSKRAGFSSSALGAVDGAEPAYHAPGRSEEMAAPTRAVLMGAGIASFCSAGIRRLMPSLVVDPEWPHPERSINETDDMMRGCSRSSWPTKSATTRRCSRR